MTPENFLDEFFKGVSLPDCQYNFFSRVFKYAMRKKRANN